MTFVEGLVMVASLLVAAIMVAGIYWYLLERSAASGREHRGRPLGAARALPQLGMLGICVALAWQRWSGGEAAIGALQNDLYFAALAAGVLVSGVSWLTVARWYERRRFVLWLNTFVIGLCAGIGLGTVDWEAPAVEVANYFVPMLLLLSVYLQLLQARSDSGTGSVGIVERLRRLERMQQTRRQPWLKP